ncbi:MAG: hypothetical protein GX442_17610 [Candidatus Riflebacteria bacterium]|nr:hypothetical protein [Candidatus Riflebacteria bacterium]
MIARPILMPVPHSSPPAASFLILLGGGFSFFGTPAFRLTHQSTFFIHPAMLMAQIVLATPFAISPLSSFSLLPSGFLWKC